MAKDDFAGFSLGMHFSLYVLVPLTLSLFLAACLLDPPAWLLKRLGVGVSPSQRSTSTLRTAIVGFCLASAAVIFLGAAYFVVRENSTDCDPFGVGCRAIRVKTSGELTVEVYEELIQCDITNLSREWTCRDHR